MLLLWLIGSRIRPFGWCQNQRLWMTLNGRYILYCTKHASFGAHHDDLNEDRPILSQEKCSPITLFSGNIRLMRVFPDVSLTGGAKRQWCCRQRQFLVLSLAISLETLEIRLTLLYSDTQSLVAFRWSQNAWPWMTLNGYFTLNSVFAPVRLTRRLRFSKAIAWKLIKIDLHCQR